MCELGKTRMAVYVARVAESFRVSFYELVYYRKLKVGVVVQYTHMMTFRKLYLIIHS